MKRTFALLILATLCSSAALAQRTPPTKIDPVDIPGDGAPIGGGGGTPTNTNLVDHGRGTMPYAKVVYLFWGSVGYGAELQAYRDFPVGMTQHMSMLAQYNAPQSSLSGGQPDVFDWSEPPATVTDYDVRMHLNQYFGGNYDPNTVYVVVLGPGHDARDPFDHVSGTEWCAYHWDTLEAGVSVKYVVVPYETSSCAKCAVTAGGVVGSPAQIAEVSIIHEVREAMTDPTHYSWFDSARWEADDKCEPSLAPSNAFSYQMIEGPMDNPNWHPAYLFFFQKEWSNAAHGCVQ